MESLGRHTEAANIHEQRKALLVLVISAGVVGVSSWLINRFHHKALEVFAGLAIAAGSLGALKGLGAFAVAWIADRDDRKVRWQARREVHVDHRVEAVAIASQRREQPRDESWLPEPTVPLHCPPEPALQVSKLEPRFDEQHAQYQRDVEAADRALAAEEERIQRDHALQIGHLLQGKLEAAGAVARAGELQDQAEQLAALPVKIAAAEAMPREMAELKAILPPKRARLKELGDPAWDLRIYHTRKANLKSRAELKADLEEKVVLEREINSLERRYVICMMKVDALPQMREEYARLLETVDMKAVERFQTAERDFERISRELEELYAEMRGAIDRARENHATAVEMARQARDDAIDALVDQLFDAL